MNDRVSKFVYNELTSSDDFRIWLIAFESYCKASDRNVSKEDMALALLSTLGEHGHRTLMAHSENYDKMNYDDMVQVLTKRYVKKDQKQLFIVFTNMRMGENDKSEKLSDYVERIRIVAQLLKRAKDNDIIEKLLSDPVVSKLDDGKVFEKLMQDDMTVDKLLDWYSARESIIKIRSDMAARDTCLNLLKVPYVKSRNNSQSSNSSYKSTNSNGSYKNYSNNKRWCRFCGLKDYPHEQQCRATGKECNNCHELGHFERCCPKKKQQRRINQIDTEAETFSEANENIQVKKTYILRYINSVSSMPCPKAIICCNNNDLVQVMLDTGSQSNVMTADTYYKMDVRPQLNHTSVRLIPFNATQHLPTLGEITTPVTWLGETKLTTFVIVKSNKHVENLLCYETMTSFSLDWNSVFKINTPDQNKDNQTKQVNSTSSVSNNTNYVDGVDTVKLDSIQLSNFIQNKYKHEFRNETGLVPDYEAHVTFNTTAKQTKCPPHHIANRMLKACKQKIETWQNKDIAEAVTYQDNITWISSLNPVEKANDKSKDQELGPDDIRLTIDLRNVNKCIIRDTHCTMLPDSKQIAYDLSNATVFSKLDVRDAFSTIPLDEESRQHFVFSTPFGLYRLKRLVQGMCNSSDIYHQYITDHFKDINLTKSCIDDFMVYGKPDHNDSPDAELNSIANHDRALFATLDRIRSLNMTLNPTKCKFRQDNVPFYGNDIAKVGIKPFDKKLKAFKETHAPKDKQTLHSFIGMAAHFHERLPNLANNGNLLYELLRKNKTYEWTEQHQIAFEDVKNSLFKGYLAHFDENKQTDLYVDAGPYGIAFVLTQIDAKGRRSLIECGSHTFTQTQSRYSQIEKETLALVWTVEKLKLKLLLLPKLQIYTDSKSVVDIMNNVKTRQSKSTRIQSWISNLPGGDYKVKHISGKNNIADFISRCHNNDKCDTFDQKFKTIYNLSAMESFSIKDITEATNNDTDLINVKNAILHGKTLQSTNKYITIFNLLSIGESGEILLNNKIVIPLELENKVLKSIHAGHNGYPRCEEILRKFYYFPKMNSKMKQLIDNCRACQATKPKQQPEPMIIQSKPTIKFDVTSIDFSSMTPSNNYMLVLTEALSGYPIMKISKNLKSSSAISILKQIFKEFNFVPKIIRSDNGPAFISKEFKDFVTEYNIEHQLTTPYWPNANGMPENRMKIINKSIRCSKVTNTSWEKILDKSLKIYRATKHPSTNYSPNDILGLPDDIGLPIVKTTSTIDPNKIINHDIKMKLNSKKFNDKNKHAKKANLKIGDKVIYRWDSTKSKHLPRYDPKEYTITAAKGTMMTASRDDHTTTRNASFFQKVNYIQAIIPQSTVECYMFSDPFHKRRQQLKQKLLEEKEQQLAELIKQNQTRINTQQQHKSKTSEHFSSISDDPDQIVKTNNIEKNDQKPSKPDEEQALINNDQQDNTQQQSEQTSNENLSNTDNTNKQPKNTTPTEENESKDDQYETPKHSPPKKRLTATEKLVQEADKFLKKQTASEDDRKTLKSGEGDNISDKT